MLFPFLLGSVKVKTQSNGKENGLELSINYKVAVILYVLDQRGERNLK